MQEDTDQFVEQFSSGSFRSGHRHILDLSRFTSEFAYPFPDIELGGTEEEEEFTPEEYNNIQDGYEDIDAGGTSLLTSLEVGLNEYDDVGSSSPPTVSRQNEVVKTQEVDEETNYLPDYRLESARARSTIFVGLTRNPSSISAAPSQETRNAHKKKTRAQFEIPLDSSNYLCPLKKNIQDSESDISQELVIDNPVLHEIELAVRENNLHLESETSVDPIEESKITVNRELRPKVAFVRTNYYFSNQTYSSKNTPDIKKSSLVSCKTMKTRPLPFVPNKR